MPPDLYKEIDSDKRRVAVSFPKDQVTALNAGFIRDNPVLFGDVIFHELMHLKSHLTIEAEKEAGTEEGGEKKITKTEFRSGLGGGSISKIPFSRKISRTFLRIERSFNFFAGKSFL